MDSWARCKAKTDEKDLNLLNNYKAMIDVLRSSDLPRNEVEECISELEKEISKLSVN